MIYKVSLFGILQMMSLCLQFKLVHGRQITGIHLDMRNGDKHYNLIVSDYTLHLIDNDNLYCNNQLTFTKCFSDIPPGNNWKHYMYVMESYLKSMTHVLIQLL